MTPHSVRLSGADEVPTLLSKWLLDHAARGRRTNEKTHLNECLTVPTTQYWRWQVMVLGHILQDETMEMQEDHGVHSVNFA
jgi:hypothetical protein